MLLHQAGCIQTSGVLPDQDRATIRGHFCLNDDGGLLKNEAIEDRAARFQKSI
jgi:hypothetical protein